MPPAVALGFVIIALLGVLIVMGIKGGLLGGGSSSNSDMVKLKAEVDARRNELNRQRVSMGLAPLVVAELYEIVAQIAAYRANNGVLSDSASMGGGNISP